MKKLLDYDAVNVDIVRDLELHNEMVKLVEVDSNMNELD